MPIRSKALVEGERFCRPFHGLDLHYQLRSQRFTLGFMLSPSTRANTFSFPSPFYGVLYLVPRPIKMGGRSRKPGSAGRWPASIRFKLAGDIKNDAGQRPALPG